MINNTALHHHRHPYNTFAMHFKIKKQLRKTCALRFGGETTASTDSSSLQSSLQRQCAAVSNFIRILLISEPSVIPPPCQHSSDTIVFAFILYPLKNLCDVPSLWPLTTPSLASAHMCVGVVVQILHARNSTTAKVCDQNGLYYTYVLLLSLRP